MRGEGTSAAVRRWMAELRVSRTGTRLFSPQMTHLTIELSRYPDQNCRQTSKTTAKRGALARASRASRNHLNPMSTKPSKQSMRTTRKQGQTKGLSTLGALLGQASLYPRPCLARRKTTKKI